MTTCMYTEMYDDCFIKYIHPPNTLLKCTHITCHTHTHTITPHIQTALQAAKQELDHLKLALRERNKELQKFEQERRSHEKEKVDASLKIKELEHKIAKFHKDSKDAAQKVSSS